MIIRSGLWTRADPSPTVSVTIFTLVRLHYEGRTAFPHSAQSAIEHSEGMLGIDGVACSPCAVRELLETLSKLEYQYVQRIAYQVLTPTRLDSLPL